MLECFSDRAQECVRLAERAQTGHDRAFFLALARAFYGLIFPEADVSEGRL